MYGIEYSWKGHKDRKRQELNVKACARSTGLCQRHKRQHPYHVKVSPWRPYPTTKKWRHAKHEQSDRGHSISTLCCRIRMTFLGGGERGGERETRCWERRAVKNTPPFSDIVRLKATISATRFSPADQMRFFLSVMCYVLLFHAIKSHLLL